MELLAHILSGREYITINNIPETNNYMLVDTLNGKILLASGVCITQLDGRNYIEWAKCEQQVNRQQNDCKGDVFIDNIIDIQCEYLKQSLEKTIIIKENLNKLETLSENEKNSFLKDISDMDINQKMDHIIAIIDYSYIQNKVR